MHAVPARAYATTRGGEAREFALVRGWTRPTKFRFDSTAAATMSAKTSDFQLDSNSFKAT